MTQLPQYENIRTILYETLNLNREQRSRVHSAWKDYLQELDAEPSPERQQRLRKEADELLSRPRIRIVGRGQKERVVDVVPARLLEDLAAADVDDRIMWSGGKGAPLDGPVPRYLVELLGEYDSAPFVSQVENEGERKKHLESKLWEWYDGKRSEQRRGEK